MVRNPLMSKINKPVTNRRDFVQKLVGGIAISTAAATGVVLASGETPPEEIKKKAKNYGMLIDTRRCIGCHTCSVSCKSEFDVPLGVTRSWVEYTEKGTYPNVSRHFLPRL